MSAAIVTFAPELSQLAGLATLLGVVLGFAVVGVVAAGARAVPEGGPLYGWAIAVTLFTLLGVTRAIPFDGIALALLALVLAGALVLAKRRRPPVSLPLLRATAVALPLIVLVAAMMPSQWDEFTNWLPNARFLYEHDAFPGPGLPPNPSVFPAYPYALPLVIYLASLIAGHLVENAVALFNLILLVTFGVLVARIMRDTLAAGPEGATVAGDGRLGWGWCAFGVLIGTVLNPTFVHKIAFTAYADTATAVALGFAAVYGWKALNALAENEPAEARAMAWQFGLAATALVAIKQVNLLLLAVLAGAVVLVALRDPRIAARALPRLAPAALVLPLVVYAAWRLYVAVNMTGGEFAIRPPAEWLVALIPDTLAQMALIASKKSGYFGLMLVAVAFALRALWRVRGSFDRLALIAGAVFLGYNAFLLFAYITAFTEYEARTAGSYWRYNMHLGGICVLFAGCGAAKLWRRYAARGFRPRLGWLAVVIVVALPFALIDKLRFDLRPRYIETRATAVEIAQMLPASERLLLVDLESNGEYLVIMRYVLHGAARIVGEITAYDQADAARLSEIVRTTAPSHIWLYRPFPAAEAALDIRLPPGASYLLQQGEQWRVVHQWPHGTSSGR